MTDDAARPAAPVMECDDPERAERQFLVRVQCVTKHGPGILPASALMWEVHVERGHTRAIVDTAAGGDLYPTGDVLVGREMRRRDRIAREWGSQ